MSLKRGEIQPSQEPMVLRRDKKVRLKTLFNGEIEMAENEKLGLEDNWKNRSQKMFCKTCRFYVPKAREGKASSLGRCRKHAPTLEGWPVMFPTDWCGSHKLDENAI